MQECQLNGVRASEWHFEVGSLPTSFSLYLVHFLTIYSWVILIIQRNYYVIAWDFMNIHKTNLPSYNDAFHVLNSAFARICLYIV